MIGRRVSTGRGGALELLKPGDYGKDNRGTWWVIVPTETNNSHRFPLDEWNIVENKDRTITVTPSIWYMPGQGAEAHEWHGYLTNGEWQHV